MFLYHCFYTTRAMKLNNFISTSKGNISRGNVTQFKNFKNYEILKIHREHLDKCMLFLFIEFILREDKINSQRFSTLNYLKFLFYYSKKRRHKKILREKLIIIYYY